MAANDDNIDSDNTDEVYHDVEYLDNQNVNFAAGLKNGIINNFDDNSIMKITDQSLIKACIIGDIRLIEEYLASGHDVNEFLVSGWTLLLYAASYVQSSLVQYLLNLGADPNLHQEGQTSLMALCLSSKGSPSSRLQCLKLLIEGNADVNLSNKLKETPLMLACRMQEIDFISELLKHVVHINFADSEQRTALFYAVMQNRYDIVKLLIENGADINWINYRGLTPYDVAIAKGYDELISLLSIEDDENHYEEIVKTNNVTDWLDMFPTITGMDMDSLDSDVVNMLYGMGLESYSNFFRGIDLKTFLRLREEDLERLGIDISVHRKKFFDELFRFHQYEWKSNLKFDNSQLFSAFETMKVLGNLNKQLSVMSSSLYFSKTFLDSIEDNEEPNFTADDREKLKIEMENMQLIALRIKEATEKVRMLAENINELSSDLTLPIHIERKNKNIKHKWIIITVITLVGIYLFRLRSSKRWYNDEKSSSKSWRDIFKFSLTNMLYDKFCRISLYLRNN